MHQAEHWLLAVALPSVDLMKVHREIHSGINRAGSCIQCLWVTPTEIIKQLLWEIKPMTVMLMGKEMLS